ncbi:uncharacterized protein LOC110642397 isoform X2 [Hevea brasiliensis]|uniref:uncharacterized protein LOC110642397 isoform X2 n=1 Tax=Hevea brasiliensis TaxID=3981 RepID=UPI0025F34400|nr:uncharacterized protein LOC110642397 isoform X2 [Hevea brasiliensis]
MRCMAACWLVTKKRKKQRSTKSRARLRVSLARSPIKCNSSSLPFKTSHPSPLHSPLAANMSKAFSSINPQDYAHSPVHYAVALADHTTLSRLVSSLPRLADPANIHTESDSFAQERLADQISAVLDRRDVPHRETPLHLSVRLNDSFAARTLAASGADISLQNSAGWNPLQEALCRRNSEIASILLRLHHRSAWAKWRRRLPLVIAVLRRMRDFYMEISFHFESSVIPFVGKIAPSDTYKIWKRDGNLRADTSLAGFDGLKIQRADQSFLFLGDGDHIHNIPSGFCSQTSVYRPGMDVTKAELVGRTNWRRQEKTESVGEWKAKVYEVHNVVFSFRSRKVADSENEVAGSEQVLPLELDEDDDGFLVAENPNFGFNDDRRRHSSFVREEREWVTLGRKSVDIIPSSSLSAMSAPQRRSAVTIAPTPQTKEKEYVRSLRPSVWLTDQFPLKTEELLPLLDILANKVKAVRRMRELLTTKFPAGMFPVKVAIPVVPTVRVVITFTKFIELQSTEQFYTPVSSPRHFVRGGRVASSEDDQKSDTHYLSLPSTSSSISTGWLRRNNSQSASKQHQRCPPHSMGQQLDPFTIPSGYTWTNADDKSSKMKKSKSVRKSK